MAVDGRGYQPLHDAASGGNVRGTNVKSNVYVVRALVEHGADVEARDRHGRTALHCACHARSMDPSVSLDVVTYLLSVGADLNAEDYEGRHAVHNAAASGRVEVARLLVEAGAYVMARDWSGETAEEIARTEGRFDVVLYLRGLRNKHR